MPPEFLQSIAALKGPRQAGADYGLSKSLVLKEELARYWRIAGDLYARYAERQARHDLRASQVGVDEWLVPLLQAILGYDDLVSAGPATLGERVFKLTHRACGQTVPLLLTTRDFNLDKADARFGYEGRRIAPHGLMQEYLNGEDHCLWGIVSNGSKLRVLRDNPSLTRPTYIEADLDLVFAEELYADFAAFWLAVHASRFTPENGKPSTCVIEGWRAKAHETGERVLSNLRDGVTEALRQLGDGLLQHPDNVGLRSALREGTLTPESFFEQLLRLVYRMLFLFTAEERDLLHAPDAAAEQRAVYSQGYSLSRLRERALRRRYYDQHADTWVSLQITFQGLAHGAAGLGLPPLGGLFRSGQCPNLDRAAIANEPLLDAVRSLAFFRSDTALTRVNYRDMGTEELGSVYESLLELQPHLNLNGAPWTIGFVNLENGGRTRGSERKLTGSYYTPSSLVNELIKSALEPILAETVAGHPDNPRKAILDLRVLDPACGSGHFLLAAARRMAAEIARIETGTAVSDETTRQRALREVVQRCIYGVDRNTLAVELCKTALWIETVEPGKPLTFLDSQIRLGDSLVGIFDPEVISNGIPADAYKPLSGDDRGICSELRRRNRTASDAVQGDLFDDHTLTKVATASARIDAMPEDTIDDVARKSVAWVTANKDNIHEDEQLRANLFVGAFFAEKTVRSIGTVPHTEDLNRLVVGVRQRNGVAAAVKELACRYRFFHWHLSFPEIMQRGGFDVVVGNPPYLSAIDQRAAGFTRHKQFWSTMYSSARGAYDLFVLFLELGAKLLSARGRASLLTPNKYLAAPYAEALRTMIGKDNRLFSITDVSSRDAFADASVYPVISTFVGVPLSERAPIESRVPSDSASGFQSVFHDRTFLKTLPNQSWGILLASGAALIQRISGKLVRLGALLEIGASTTAAEADEFTSGLYEQENFRERAAWRVINTGLIDPFCTRWGMQNMRHSGQAMRRPILDARVVSQRRMLQYSRSKIIVAKLGRKIEAFFDDKGEYAALNVNFVFAEGESGYFYLGQLNSRVSSWLYRQMFGALRMGGGYLQFQAPQIRAMPVVRYDLDNERHRTIASLARRLSRRPDDRALQAAIDVEVAELFGFTRSELETIGA